MALSECEDRMRGPSPGADSTFLVESRVYIKGASEQLADLILFVANQVGAQIHPSVKAQILAFLQQALSNPRNTPLICQRLDWFIALVESRLGANLPPNVRTQMVNDARRIKAVLACS